MKLQFILKITILILFSTTINYNSFSQEYENTISKQYPCTKGDILKIDNKYGNINISNWDKDVVSIELIISIEEVNEQRANSLYSKINKYISKSGKYIRANTKLSTDFKTTKDFRIDYKIVIPKYMNVDLNNKFGDITLEEVSTSANINLHYGDLYCKSISKEHESKIGSIDLKYAKAKINYCGRSKINLSFSEIEIYKSNDLYINSISSKINVNESNSIILDSKYDTYNINEIKNLSISLAEKSNFTIKYLSNTLESIQKHCKLNIYKLDRLFTHINLNVENTNCLIQTDNNSEYVLNIENTGSQIMHAKNFKTNYTDYSSNTEKKELVIGQSDNVYSRIKIISKKGNINIK